MSENKLDCGCVGKCKEKGKHWGWCVLPDGHSGDCKGSPGVGLPAEDVVPVPTPSEPPKAHEHFWRTVERGGKWGTECETCGETKFDGFRCAWCGGDDVNSMRHEGGKCARPVPAEPPKDEPATDKVQSALRGIRDIVKGRCDRLDLEIIREIVDAAIGPEDEHV